MRFSLEDAKRLWAFRHLHRYAEVPEIAERLKVINIKRAELDILEKEVSGLDSEVDQLISTFVDVRNCEEWKGGFLIDKDYTRRRQDSRFRGYDFYSPHTCFEAELKPLVNGGFQIIGRIFEDGKYSMLTQSQVLDIQDPQLALDMAKNFVIFGTLETPSIIE